MPYPRLALPNTFNWLGFLVSMFNERNLFPSSYPEKSASSLFPSNIFILLTRLAGSVWRAAHRVTKEIFGSVDIDFLDFFPVCH